MVTSRFHFAWQRWLAFCGWSTLAMFAYVFLVSAGPALEAKVAPVIIEPVMRPAGLTPAGDLVFTIAYTKTRDCRLYDIEWYGIDADNVTQFAYATDPNGRPSRPSTRPIGRNVSRPYHLYLTDDSVSFFAVIWHRCGLPWTSRQTIGPFDRWWPMPEANPVPR